LKNTCRLIAVDIWRWSDGERRWLRRCVWAVVS